MSKLIQFFAVLFRGSKSVSHDESLVENYKAAETRLHAAQNNFESVVRELLDQNERLRSRNVHPEKPR